MDRNDNELRPEDLIGDPENPNSPAQMLEALVNKAMDTGSMRPLGQAFGGIQAQMDSIFGMMQMNLQKFGQYIQTHNMQIEVLRMTLIALIDLIQEKGIFSEEEWDAHYEENVQKKLEERHEAARKAHEEAVKQAQIDEQMGMTEEELKEEEAAEAAHECENCKGCEETEEAEKIESNVVLPSEREGAVVKFPSKKEE